MGTPAAGRADKSRTDLLQETEAGPVWSRKEQAGGGWGQEEAPPPSKAGGPGSWETLDSWSPPTALGWPPPGEGLMGRGCSVCGLTVPWPLAKPPAAIFSPLPDGQGLPTAADPDTSEKTLGSNDGLTHVCRV
uniref:Uncharacterized protein n=1 Tax=Molossus molossus TaxID=27622 RepID=A0A7J8BMZ0_MOLMO|nr:hypothetical protein HJG59_010144 [Molossus molossus]